MSRIAFILGETFLYRDSLVLALAAAAAICQFLSLYLHRGGSALGAAVLIPLSLAASLFLARLWFWYCRPTGFASLHSAVTDFSTGGYALMGAFLGCILVAALLRVTGLLRDLPDTLDCMSIAGGAGIAVGRLACLFTDADRGQLLQSFTKLPLAYPVTDAVTGEVEYRLATFMLQSIVTGVITVLLAVIFLVGHSRRKLRGGTVTLLFMLLYGASQIVLDSTRYDSLYLRSNGFISVVQILGAAALLASVAVFSVRMVRAMGFRVWQLGLWTAIAALVGGAGYMEYHVQRHGNQAVFAYSVMTACLAGIICITVAIWILSGRKLRLEDKPVKHTIKTKRVLPLAAALIIAAGCAVAGKWYFSHHVRVGGRFYSRDAVSLDVRGVSPAEYDAIRGEIPQADILWELPFQGKQLPLDTQEIRVQTLTDEDVLLLNYLPRLRTVDASGCENYTQLAALRQSRPDVDVKYQVKIGGESYPSDAAEITAADADAAELKTMLPFLSQLGSVRLTGTLPEASALQELRSSFPDITFAWETEIGGTRWDSAAAAVNAAGAALPDIGRLTELLTYLPELKTADFRGCGLSEADFQSLMTAFPNCFFPRPVVIGGAEFDTDTEEIDLSGIELESMDEIESMLPQFPNLKKVIMSGCGFSDEEMDALNQRNEVRFVWTVDIGGIKVRTDDTYFIPVKFRKRIETKHIYPLRYCTDMISIDIGHMWVDNCEWAAFMPNLKYLVIGETAISDLTPLSGLKNLVYLEMFTIPVTDYSPLLGCTGLEDLNLGKTYADPTPISKMTWLKNLWWFAADGRPNVASAPAPKILPEALPNTNIKFRVAHPTAGGWRKLPNYFNMRDAMDMFYLT